MSKTIRISGTPNERQKAFFLSTVRFTAYGGARGGGKSWALRRKLCALCLRYPGISCLIVRRSLAELRSNHLTPFLREFGRFVSYSESEKTIFFPNKSRIVLGYCSSERDTLRYQGQEYDIIAIDEATQLSEYQFSVFKACLRGVGSYPRRMYLTCNPGGVGHGWVKRLFIDRDFRQNENPADYAFIPAAVYDNKVLCESDPGYIKALESLPPKLRDAWLYGKWDIFAGQFFPEFDADKHIYRRGEFPGENELSERIISLDYGFDRLAALRIAFDKRGGAWVEKEYCESGLILSEAAENTVKMLISGDDVQISAVIASPDLWNRRQDSGRSGYEIMQRCPGMPPMVASDDRRIAGWRVVREYLSGDEPKLRISDGCGELLHCLPLLLCDDERFEDASSEPHSVTHAPEALRYGLMHRRCIAEESPLAVKKQEFRFSRNEFGYW